MLRVTSNSNPNVHHPLNLMPNSTQPGCNPGQSFSDPNASVTQCYLVNSRLYTTFYLPPPYLAYSLSRAYPQGQPRTTNGASYDTSRTDNTQQTPTPTSSSSSSSQLHGNSGGSGGSQGGVIDGSHGSATGPSAGNRLTLRYILAYLTHCDTSSSSLCTVTSPLVANAL